MKKYSALLIVGVVLLVAGYVVAQKIEGGEVAAEKSVEFSIAEPSQDGEGLAMPASGSSGQTSDLPGCSLAVDQAMVDNGQSITIRWEHFKVSQANPGLNDLIRSGTNLEAIANQPKEGALYSYNNEGWRPANYDYVSGKIEGAACMGYCNVADPDCNLEDRTLKSFSEMNGLIDVNAGTSGSTISQGIVEKSNVLAKVMRMPKIMPLVQASSGGGTYTCDGAVEQSGYTTVQTGSDTLENGVFMIVMGTYYSDLYGSHHNQYAYSACYDYVTVSAAPVPEITTSITNVLGTTVLLGQNVSVSSLIRNIGEGATDRDLKGGQDGRIRYEFALDLNNDGSVDYRVNNDATISGSTGNVMAANTQRTISASIPSTELTTGTHKLTFCVNQPTASRRFDEITYTNNCSQGTFKVTVPDLAAYVYPAEAIIGSTAVVLTGYSINVGKVAVKQDFNNEFQVRQRDNTSNSLVLTGDRYTADVPPSAASEGGGAVINSAAFNPATKFGNDRNLEYRLWTDSPTSEVREVSGNDNARGDATNNTTGNNDSDWGSLTLVPPDVSAESRMPNPARYDTGVVISMPFRIHNELALDMVRTFTSVAAIDMDGDCGSNVSVTDSCIEFLTDEETTTSILASSYDSVSFAWETDFPGTYRVKVFADNKDILDEDVENNNATPWVSFTVVEDLSCIPGDSGCNECSPGDPGCTGSCDPTVDTNCPPPDQDVYITATPTVIRKGATVTIGWDITDRDPATCKVLINDSVALKSPVPSKTGTVTDAPTQRTQYKLDCAADGSYVRSQDTVDVNVLPSLYES